MADASHLERMGRELKCPICLSLLNSAVSLTCNHVFCNSCIEKSMRSASNCPVCKVPYRRREIRPAPHMDNLVSVYKSMEVASGVNIFVTQNAASTKISGQDNETGVNHYDSRDNDKVQQETIEGENQKLGRQKGSKSASMSNQEAFGSNLTKPSFPAKKRVQVPHHPTSDTQMQPEMLEDGILINEARRSHTLPKDMPSMCENEKPILSPFFWLREEEDLEKSTQQTDGNQIMYTPPEIPSFSDIKDSDDDVPSKQSPNRGTCTQPENADFFDSEMFDWTQRPCSPELCSSPQSMQIVDVDRNSGAQGKEKAPLTDTTAGLKVSRNKREPKAQRERAIRTSENKGATRISNKRGGNATEARKSKRTKKTVCEVTAVPADTEMIMGLNMQIKSGNKEKPLKLKGKQGKNKKSCSEVVQEMTIENAATLSDVPLPLVKCRQNACSDLAPSENPGRISESNKLNKSSKPRKETRETNAQAQKFGGKVNHGKLKTGKGHKIEEKNKEVLVSHSHCNSLSIGSEKESLDRVIRSRINEDDSRKGSKSLKKVKFSEEDLSKDNCNSIPSNGNDEAAIRGQIFQEHQDSIDSIGMRVPPKMDKAISTPNGSALLKCKTSPTGIHCAFCQASEESEASGNLVHYLNGKRLEHSENTISNALHVHKNCAEWAPNVYFEDDNVINLETEISRSRRIRCSCCGIKGAALGCYEKSCRKSFHVPCARLTPECRWDYENFVMLCPIHSSCQLPNEMQKSRSNQKRKYAAKSKTDTDKVKTTDDHLTPQSKLQRKFKNVVLCCSALTITEKGIVSEFENLSGVTILKNWDSTVTHVIASTDENGACRRTLKFLMGVLEGKWILGVHWLKACIEAGDLVDEQPYELAVDIHGTRDGPRLGRLRILNKQAKLFDGYKFFFMGDFAPSYKGYLNDLVIAAGGKVLTRKPVVEDQSRCSATTFIIYSLELPEKCRPSNGSSILNSRRADAAALATCTGSMVATNSWILNSIAGHKLQDRGE